MVPDKLNKKYHALIWIGLIFASFVRNIYPLYIEFTTIEGGARLKVVEALLSIFDYGILPVLLCFVCALVVYSIGFRRYIRFISRNDFVYYVMAFTGAARLIAGIIECFAILNPKVYAVTSCLLDMILLSVAMLLMFFLVFAKKYKLNPVEKSNAFRMWSMIYIVGLFVLQFLPNVTLLIVNASAEAMDPAEFGELYSLLQQGYGAFIFDKITFAASLSAVMIFFVIAIVVIVLSSVLRKNAAAFRDPDKRTEYYQTHNNSAYTVRDDVFSTYSEENNFDRYAEKPEKKDDNVFDEFDI